MLEQIRKGIGERRKYFMDGPKSGENVTKKPASAPKSITAQK